MKKSPTLTPRPAVIQAEKSQGQYPRAEVLEECPTRGAGGGGCCRKRPDRESAVSQNLMGINHVLQENTSSMSMAKHLGTLKTEPSD